MSDTPETDAAIKAQSEWKLPFVSYTMGGVTYDGPVATLCRKLERERDRALMDRANGDIATMTINHYERILRERNAARELAEAFHRDQVTLLLERDNTNDCKK